MKISTTKKAIKICYDRKFKLDTFGNKNTETETLL